MFVCTRITDTCCVASWRIGVTCRVAHKETQTVPCCLTFHSDRKLSGEPMTHLQYQHPFVVLCKNFNCVNNNNSKHNTDNNCSGNVNKERQVSNKKKTMYSYVHEIYNQTVAPLWKLLNSSPQESIECDYALYINKYIYSLKLLNRK